jgi:two-component system LytT family response regulator
MNSSIIRTLIIDDDPFIRDLLKDKLEQYIPEVQLLATADNGGEGIKLINKYQPDLIFLDVEMADMTGFEMLTRLNNYNFQTIFITSYKHYAIKAIRFNALDYLVKPIDLGELKAAIKRYLRWSENPEDHNPILTALSNMTETNIGNQVLVLQTQEGTLKLPIKQIIRVEGERNYSYIYLDNGKRKLTTKTLGDMEDLLADKGFFRSHKSFLVNQSHIQSVPNSIKAILSDGTELPIARRKKEVFKTWWQGFKK